MSELVIHIVKNGSTMCGILTYEMKPTHRWVERDGLETGACTCEGCGEALERRKLRLAGKPIPPRRPPQGR